MITPLYKPGLPMRLAISLDGPGSNTRKIIEHHIVERDAGKPSYEPAMLLTGTPSSNAVKISTEYSSRGLTLPVLFHSFLDFFKARGLDSIKEDKDMPIRRAYDNITLNLLSAHGIDCVALAGDEYVKTSVICNTILTVNVHPGDLRAKYDSGKNAGKPKYTGLGWIPSAKAILAGEKEVRTSVHIVTDKLDCGPVLAVSAPQLVPEISALEKIALMGGKKSLGELIDCVKTMPDVAGKIPLVSIAKDCQERLKVNGDWVIFPKVLQYIAEGRYARDEKGSMYFDKEPIPDGKVITG